MTMLNDPSYVYMYIIIINCDLDLDLGHSNPVFSNCGSRSKNYVKDGEGPQERSDTNLCALTLHMFVISELRSICLIGTLYTGRVYPPDRPIRPPDSLRGM